MVVGRVYASCWCRVCLLSDVCLPCGGFLSAPSITVHMTVRPEIDNENIERLNEIIDKSVSVPLSSDELSINKQLQILTEAVYDEVEKSERQGNSTTLVIDRYDSRE